MNAADRVMGLIEYGLKNLNEEEASNAVHDLKKIIEVITKLDAENAKNVSEINGFWEALHNSYNIETREEIEADCKDSWAKGTSPLAVALHFVWKREPKVTKLAKLKCSCGTDTCLYCGKLLLLPKESELENESKRIH